MRRGTTPTHIFITDVDLRDAVAIYITYAQGELDESDWCKCLREEPKVHVIMEKELPNITVEETQISTKLTQEETLRFATDEDVLMQIAARFADDSAIRSQIMYTTAQKILKDEVV